MAKLGRQSTKKTIKDAPQCVVVFGLPLSGVSSAIRCLMDASDTPTALVHGIDEGEIRAAMRDGARVVFVDDFEPTEDNVQFLNDTRLVSPAGGKLIQIRSEDEDILARAQVLGRDDVDSDYLEQYKKEIEFMEERARDLGIRLFMIPNGEEFAGTVASLAELSGISD